MAGTRFISLHIAFLMLHISCIVIGFDEVNDLDQRSQARHASLRVYLADKFDRISKDLEVIRDASDQLKAGQDITLSEIKNLKSISGNRRQSKINSRIQHGRANKKNPRDHRRSQRYPVLMTTPWPELINPEDADGHRRSDPFRYTDLFTTNHMNRRASSDVLERRIAPIQDYEHDFNGDDKRHNRRSIKRPFSANEQNYTDRETSDFRFKFDSILQSSRNIHDNFNSHLPGRGKKPGNLPATCQRQLDIIGNARSIRQSSQNIIGAWMRESNKQESHTIWAVEGVNALYWNKINEYADDDQFTRQRPNRNLELSEPCTGLGIVVYRGAIYCQSATTRVRDSGGIIIIKQSLEHGGVLARHRFNKTLLSTEGVPYKGWAGVYMPVQLMADEAGLWLAAGEAQTRRLVIIKLDEMTLDANDIIITHERKDQVGPGFMRCGLFYALDSHDGLYVKFVYDTHTGKHRLLSARHLTLRVGERSLEGIEGGWREGIDADQRGGRVTGLPRKEQRRRADVIISITYLPMDQSLYVWRLSATNRSGVTYAGRFIGVQQVIPLNNEYSRE